MEDGIISGIRCTIRSTTSSVAKILRKLKYLKFEKKIKELNIYLYETLHEYILKNNKKLIKDIEKKLKTTIHLIQDNNIAPPFFILKTVEMIKKKKKLSVLYDDVPKLVNEEEIKENRKDNKKEKEIKVKTNTKKIEKKNTLEEKENINEINTLIK